jgi:hypothetical protein
MWPLQRAQSSARASALFGLPNHADVCIAAKAHRFRHTLSVALQKIQCNHWKLYRMLSGVIPQRRLSLSTEYATAPTIAHKTTAIAA